MSVSIKKEINKIVDEYDALTITNVFLTAEVKSIKKQKADQSEAYEETLKEANHVIEEKENIIEAQLMSASLQEEKINKLVKLLEEAEKKGRSREYQNKYRLDNAEKIKENNKKYKTSNETKLKNQGAEIVECGCGKSHRKDNKIRHCKSKHHEAWVDSMNATVVLDSVEDSVEDSVTATINFESIPTTTA